MRAAQDVDVLSDAPATSSPTRWGGLPLAALIAVMVIAVDRLSKVWAESRLVAGPCRPGGDECVDLVLGLRLHLVYNRGAAFSTGPRLGPLFAVIALVMAIVLLNMARSRRDRFGPLLLGLIAGGAVGNLIDRVVRADDGPLSGAVIDFIDLQWWPVFNLADSAVVVGVAAIAIQSIFASSEEEPATSEGSEPSGSGESGDGSAASEALA